MRELFLNFITGVTLVLVFLLIAVPSLVIFIFHPFIFLFVSILCVLYLVGYGARNV